MKRSLLALMLLVSGYVLAEPYVGAEFQQLHGSRSGMSYKTNQVNAIIGYDWRLDSNIKNGVEYAGPISSASGTLGGSNVETVIQSIGYKVSYDNFFGKIAYAKLDRSDSDLEPNDRTWLTSIGYKYSIDRTTSLRVSYDQLKSNKVNLSGISVGALFNF